MKGKKLLKGGKRGRHQGYDDQKLRQEGRWWDSEWFRLLFTFFPPLFPVWFVVLHLQLVKLYGRNVQLGAFAKLMSVWVKQEALEQSLVGRVGDLH